MNTLILVFAVCYTIARFGSYLDEIQDFRNRYYKKYGEWPSKQLIKDIFW